MTRWTHKGGEQPHPVDPTYNGNGVPSWWTCHKCGDVVLLDGKSVPIVTPVKKVAPTDEPPMSSQP